MPAGDERPSASPASSVLWVVRCDTPTTESDGPERENDRYQHSEVAKLEKVEIVSNQGNLCCLASEPPCISVLYSVLDFKGFLKILEDSTVFFKMDTG